MRAAPTRAKPGVAHLAINTLQLAVGIAAALSLNAQFLRALDDPMVSAMITLMVCLAVVVLFGSTPRRRT